MTPQDLTSNFPTLFILIAAVIIYRVVDLFSTKQKIEQLAMRNAWENYGRIRYSMIRTTARNTKNAKAILWRFKFLMVIREEFFAILAAIMLVIFTFLGVCVFSSNGTASVNFIVAIITFVISLAVSALNLTVENVRVYL